MEYTYTSLHNHSEYSNLKLIDSTNRPERLLDYAFELGLKGMALTDHDSVAGHVRIWNYYNKHFTEEQRKDFKLILGNEIYLCRDDLTPENHQVGENFFHFILLAKDDIGHEQIRQLSSRAWSRAYMRNIMRTPTFSGDLFDIIGANPGHVIATTACIGGYCGKMYLNGQLDKIERHLGLINGLFGAENFFIELQPSWRDDQIRYNRYMVDHYWGKYNFIFTTDSHYLKAKDAKVHKYFLNSKSSKDREVDSFYASAYMMSTEEVKEYLVSDKGSGISEDKFRIMCENTNKICDSIGTYNLSHTSVIPKIKFDAAPLDEFYKLLCTKYPTQTQSLQAVIQNNDPSDIHLLNLLVEPWKIHIKPEDEKNTTIELDYEFKQLFSISQQLGQSMSNYFITMAKMIDIMWDEGDSIVGPGRGSGGSSIINYLLGITQINPLKQSVELPFWRFLHADRPGLPDIDIDTEANKRVRVFNKVQQYFQSIGGDMIHVCTFGTETSRAAINTAAKGLEIDDDVASYLTAMIPNQRGKDWTLEQCYIGDDEHPQVKTFKEEIDKYPMLWEVASSIEGLITRLGCHASGVLALNEPAWKSNSIMKTTSGVLVTAFDLEDTEQLGGVKYDYLTVQALDKIRTCMNLLLEDDRMEWQGSLRATYNKYLHPDVINYDDRGMWDSLYKREIPSCFQFDTQVGGQAIQEIHPTNLAELTAGNGLMRLMATEDGVLPLDLYVQHKNHIDMWYDEMREAGLTLAEMKVLEPYLNIVYGVAVSQETMMRMSMDPHISGFTVGEANILRKAVAKKKADVLQKGKELFYSKGLALGTREQMLDYIWNKQIMLQAGYSFSDIHAVAYSYIALQEMNLSYFYPSIAWKCACLSVDAGAVNEEDYYNLVDTGVIELTDEEDKRDQNKVQYGKMAAAISRYKEFTNIELPDINIARFGFTPDIEHNSIMFGMRGISRVGEQNITDIVVNRPYKSLQNFLDKMQTKDGKKLISKDRVVNLIKAGAFDALEGKPREQILKEYVLSVCDQKQKLNLMNYSMLMKKGLMPSELDFSGKVYNFTKYIRKMRYMGNYILDDMGYGFYSENYDLSKIKQIQNDAGELIWVIGEKTWDAIYDNEMNKVRAYIKANHDELLQKLNTILFEEEYNKYAKGDILQWELDSLSFYYSGHPLTNVAAQLPCEVTSVKNLREDDFDGFWMIKGKRVPKYKLHTILGAVLDKDKTKGLVTLSTPEGIIDMKLYKQQYAILSHQLSDIDEDGNKVVTEESFVEKGTFLLVTGILRNNLFVPKVYKDTGFDPVLKIVLDDCGKVQYLLRKSED